LIRGGHCIATAENLEVKSDEEALEKCKALFAERESKFEGFEVWDGTRKLFDSLSTRLTNPGLSVRGAGGGN
jgi:hypothetical protein